MSEAEIVKSLLVRGISLNEWILELPQRVDSGIPEWNHVVLQLAEYDSIEVRTAEKSEYLHLVDEYETGLNKIADYMKYRRVVENIKSSILNERVKSA
jgi:hypothetical protein